MDKGSFPLHCVRNKRLDFYTNKRYSLLVEKLYIILLDFLGKKSMFRQKLAKELLTKSVQKVKPYIEDNREQIIGQAPQWSAAGGSAIGTVMGLFSPTDCKKTSPGRIAQKMEQITGGAIVGGVLGLGTLLYLRTAPVSIPLSYLFFKMYDKQKELENLRTENKEMEGKMNRY